MPLEYRVRWRREGRSKATRVYQTHRSAVRKVEAILALEQIKGNTRFAGMPDLAEPPTLEVREVGEWRAAEEQPTPSDRTVRRMESWAGPPEGYDIRAGF